MGGKRWTVGEIETEAKKYTTRTEFARGSRAYNSAARKGILDSVCSHMEAGRQPMYTLDEAKAAAALCRNQNEFKVRHPELHAFAYRNNAMDYVCSGLPKKKVWSDADLVSEARKYNTLSAFKNGSPSAYTSLCRKGKMGLKVEATCHMESCRTEWSDAMIYAEALGYSTRMGFKTGSSGAYQAALSRGIADDVCRHMIRVNTEWSEDKIRDEALKFHTRGDFAKFSPKAYSAAVRVGALDDVCAHMIPVFTYWSVESVAREAGKYTTKAEFMAAAGGAYQAAGRLGILDDVCTHMIPPFQWSEEELISVVNSLPSLTDLIRTRPEVYQALRKRGTLKEVTAGMPRGVHGFKPGLVSDFYAYRITLRHNEYIGFGITNDIATRHPRHVNNIKREGGVSELLFSYKMPGDVARELENRIKRSFPISDTGISGFRTEAIEYDEYALQDIQGAAMLNAARYSESLVEGKCVV